MTSEVFMKKKRIKLDKEEQELLDSFENDEWKSVKNLRHEKDVAKKAARNTLRKDARVNILSSTVTSSTKLHLKVCHIRRDRKHIAQYAAGHQ